MRHLVAAKSNLKITMDGVAHPQVGRITFSMSLSLTQKSIVLEEK